LLLAPRTDPYERNYRIRLLPRMVTTKAALDGAASRTPSSPRDLKVRLSVRSRGGCSTLSLASLLPSTDSADSEPLSLFACFYGTMKLSDSPEACMSDVWLTPSPTDPLRE